VKQAKLKGSKDTLYDRWVREVEKMPSIEGLFIDDLRTVELAPWQRKGGKGVYINLAGQRVSDAHICELAPGGQHNPEKHMFEELIFVIRGRGATSVWREGEPKLTFEWQEGALFAIPLNCWHQHFNGSGNEPVRYMALTDAPLVINRFRNLKFVFDCDFRFNDRYTFSESYFAGKGEEYSDAILKTNLVPDVFAAPLVPSPRLASHGFRRYLLSNGTMSAHIGELPPGQYRFAHRHGPGAHIIWLKGTGYDLTWETGTKNFHRINWHPLTMTSPPEWWYHQHFNLGKEPARALALHFNIRISQAGNDFLQFTRTSLKEIPFAQEDPRTREKYTRELNEAGIDFDMEETYQFDQEARAED
jgi:quercetin dioxygenase-like cupin family protein